MSDLKNWISGGSGDSDEQDTSEILPQDLLDDDPNQPGPNTRKALHLDEDDDEAASGGLGFGLSGGSGELVDNVVDLFRNYWYLILAAVVVLAVVLVAAAKLLGGGAAPAPAQNPSQGARPPAQIASNTPIKDTGVVIQQPVVKGDSYYLRSGEIAWKGKTKSTEEGQELTLEGPTAAMFRQSVNLPHGDITTGVFGRAQPNQPILHATFQRVTLGGQEWTSGTYDAVDVDNNAVLIQGTYTDKRDGDKVIRTYDDNNPDTGSERVYRVSFKAPIGTPVPALVGWQPPALPKAQSPAG